MVNKTKQLVVGFGFAYGFAGWVAGVVVVSLLNESHQAGRVLYPSEISASERQKSSEDTEQTSNTLRKLQKTLAYPATPQKTIEHLGKP